MVGRVGHVDIAGLVGRDSGRRPEPRLHGHAAVAPKLKVARAGDHLGPQTAQFSDERPIGQPNGPGSVDGHVARAVGKGKSLRGRSDPT